jgi:hypothetical protein
VNGPAAGRIARDLDAMLDDGEIDRAAYNFEDLRAAAAPATIEVARELACLADALAREQLRTAQEAARRLHDLLSDEKSAPSAARPAPPRAAFG